MSTNIKQHDISDCAVACFASVAAWYGIDIPLSVIREASGTDRTGTSFKGIMDACKELGFKSRALKSEDKKIEPLYKIGIPAILHVLTENNDLHFVVLYKMEKKYAIVMDPALGTRHKISLDTLRKQWSGYLLIMTPDPDFSGSRSSKSSIMSRLSELIRFTWKELSLSIIGAIIYIVVGISTSLFLQQIIDNVLPSNSYNSLIKVGALMGGLMLCALIIGYSRLVFTLKASTKIDSKLILKYIGHLFNLPLSFFKQRGAGELNSRIGDIVKIRVFLTENIAGIVTGAITLIVSFALMFTYYWKLALMTFIFVPLYIILYAIANKVNKRVNRDLIENAAIFEERTVEGITAVQTIKYFGSEDFFFSKIEKQYVKLADKIYKGGKYLGLFSTTSDAISKVLTLMLLIIGSLFIFNGELSVGELVSFYSLTTFFSAPLGQLVGINNAVNEAKISTERLFDIIDLEPEGTDTFELPLGCADDLNFQNISFSYPGCETLLHDFCLLIPKGKITAIQGESGCGKSSLAALLMRDYKASSGKITLGDIDINLFDLASWRDFISIVPQNAALMNGSILENITCFSTTPDIQKVSSILERLGMKQFVNSLPMGIVTKIGEQGCKLSGGQRQRIAFARVLYKNPEIIILDEATSSLDDASQRFILDEVVRQKEIGKTVIMITHKTENTKIADYIFDMSAHSHNG